MNKTELVDSFSPLFADGDLVLLALKHAANAFPEKDILVAEVHLRYHTLYKMPKSLKRKLKNASSYQTLDEFQQKEVLKILEEFDEESIKSIIDYLENPTEEAKWSIL